MQCATTRSQYCSVSGTIRSSTCSIREQGCKVNNGLHSYLCKMATQCRQQLQQQLQVKVWRSSRWQRGSSRRVPHPKPLAHGLAVGQVLLPGAGIPEVAEVLLEPNLQQAGAEGCLVGALAVRQQRMEMATCMTAARLF